jgi:carboxyl-terminal processing protease
VNSQTRKRLTVTLIVLSLMVGSFVLGNLNGYMTRSAQAQDQTPPAEFDLFWEAWNVVQNNFVDRDELDDTDMTYGAIRGMLDSLGDQGHTVFFTPEEAEQQESSLEGSFEGIGAYVGMEDGFFKILTPIHGSPAEAAGLLAGDIVLEVDGEDIMGQEQWEIISKIRGPAGTTVLLNVVHPDEDEPVDIAVVRDKIDIDSVLWSRIPGTDLAYVQITQFAADTGSELITALKEINAAGDDGEPIQGIVLDLRNNPGGYLQEAVRVGSQFLDDGEVILHSRDAQDKIYTYYSIGKGVEREMPMIVLVNEASASAAEIIAGALQENGRAELVGETTLGTGTVLHPFTLSDGSVIRLGVTNWLTPDKHLIKGQGVAPDVVVEQSPAVDMIDAIALEEMTADELNESEDAQFAEARRLLQAEVTGEDPEEAEMTEDVETTEDGRAPIVTRPEK